MELEDQMAVLRERLADYFEDLRTYRMPFGRYGPGRFPPKGMRVVELPLEYLMWFEERGGGFPGGRLGDLMEFVCQVKACGAEEVFWPLRGKGGDGGERNH